MLLYSGYVDLKKNTANIRLTCKGKSVVLDAAGDCCYGLFGWPRRFVELQSEFQLQHTSTGEEHRDTLIRKISRGRVNSANPQWMTAMHYARKECVVMYFSFRYTCPNHRRMTRAGETCLMMKLYDQPRLDFGMINGD